MAELIDDIPWFIIYIIRGDSFRSSWMFWQSTSSMGQQFFYIGFGRRHVIQGSMSGKNPTKGGLPYMIFMGFPLGRGCVSGPKKRLKSVKQTQEMDYFLGSPHLVNWLQSQMSVDQPYLSYL